MIPDWSPTYCRHGDIVPDIARRLKKYVSSMSKFTSFLSEIGRRQSAKVNQVQLSRYLSGKLTMSASFPNKMFQYVQKLSPTNLGHSHRLFQLYGKQASGYTDYNVTSTVYLTCGPLRVNSRVIA